MSTRCRSRGFTLLEILVAMVILAVMGLMAYRGVSEARIAVGNAESHLERLRAVQRSVQLIVTDFRTLTRRPVRETIGDGQRATLLRDANAVTLVELSLPAGRTAPVRRAARRGGSPTAWRTASSSANTGPSWMPRSRRHRSGANSWTGSSASSSAT